MKINFKKLPTREKYKAVMEFCQTRKKLPYYKSRIINERKMRGFLINKWNKLKRFEAKKSEFGLEEYEIECLKIIGEYKESILDKLDEVLNFCTKTKRTPRYNAISNNEKSMAKKMFSLKHLEASGKMTEEELTIMKKINEYAREPRIDKMKRLLEFCKANKRTPKQHVEDENEKRLGEFLSIAKMVHTEKFTKEENAIFSKVLKYSPKPRKYNRKELFTELLKFVIANKKIPKNSKFNTKEEKELGKFYLKLRWLNAKEQLNEEEKILFTEINSYI